MTYQQIVFILNLLQTEGVDAETIAHYIEDDLTAWDQETLVEGYCRGDISNFGDVVLVAMSIWLTE